MEVVCSSPFVVKEAYVEAALIHIGQNQSGVCAFLYHRRVER